MGVTRSDRATLRRAINTSVRQDLGSNKTNPIPRRSPPVQLLLDVSIAARRETAYGFDQKIAVTRQHSPAGVDSDRQSDRENPPRVDDRASRVGFPPKASLGMSMPFRRTFEILREETNEDSSEGIKIVARSNFVLTFVRKQCQARADRSTHGSLQAENAGRKIAEPCKQTDVAATSLADASVDPAALRLTAISESGLAACSSGQAIIP